jgi:hypothetical protein
MHETYRMLAQTRIDDRLREAAAWRRADEARTRDAHRSLSIRVRALLAHRRDRRQPAVPATAALAALAADGSSCA